MVPNNATPPKPPTGPGNPPPPAPQPVEEAAPIQPKASCSPFLTPGNLLVLGMFAAAIVGVYVLGRRVGPATALAGQELVHAKVEAALSVLEAGPTPGDLAQRTTAKAIVGEFYTAAKQRQIGVRGLRGNPFIFQDIREREPPPPAPEPAKVPVDTVPEDQKQALAQLKTLKLQSILFGPQTTMAVISSNMVTAGEEIGGWKVERITAQEVELSWKDLKHVLVMQK
ncbi:MAG TPA: hypothetical protein VM695_12610 [Phycisphaerae bacterium]|nr:hypothetical protein [Phycisphaerae bacterium]